ncbi:GTP-binding protein Rheb homolog [Physella acuta]|uniref:GTP-binding protein Rheb homolog n=1 Tax=Physella acuta TaxID=109671 RepID=UPI0027DBE947|nr:GTP-binding protein Rheb homolog [Physella acuta]
MPPKERKIAFMGFRSVGKSSLIIQYVENQFVDSYDPTIENTFSKTTRVGGQDYELHVIDTAGQDEYSVIPQSYFININGYVLVYSVNSQKSFEVVKHVYDKIIDMKGRITVPIVLVGNKKDLRFERVISEEEGRRLAESWKVPFLEASAKENSSVKDIFDTILNTMRQKENGETQEKGSCVLS